MKIRNVLIFGLFLAVIALAVTVYYKDKALRDIAQQIQGNSPVEIIDDAHASTNIDTLMSELSDEYKNASDFQTCAIRSVDACLSQAINRKIDNGGSVESCEDFFVKTARESCYANHAMRKAREGGDVSMCEHLSEQYKTACMQEAAIVKSQNDKNLEACDVLNTTARVNCINRAAAHLAQTTQDAAWCDEIEGLPNEKGKHDGREQKSCKETVQELQKNNTQQETVAERVAVAENGENR